MAVNGSVVFDDLPPLPAYTLTPRPPLLSPIPDNILALILPIVAYWGLSMIYHFIDVNDYFPQYRLHTPAEVLKRNHVSRFDVVKDVVLQQVVQTIAGMLMGYFDPVECDGKEEYDIAVWARRLRILQRLVPRVLALVGVDALGLAKNLSSNGHTMLAGALAGGNYPGATQSLILENGTESVAPAFTGWELAAAGFIYWYFIPAIQFAWAVSVVDTWQYFLHRAMHLNRWLYVKFHSRHHRLYVPYAFGALYNHPVEGFLLDTAGTGVAFLTARMTNRQSIWFFTFSTIKTVDDHCGYAFPWDPLQHITSNNAAYHDIHHQSWGIKTNFSQPFFTIWDRFLGTQWKGDVKLRYERARETAQRLVDNDPTQSTDVTADEASAANSSNESAVVSPEGPTDSNARTRLRRKTATLSSDGFKGVNHGVTSGVLQA
ncbi:hypothetical protein ASPWEDRAFT_171584 [Aspergillus wentii DTO 134E9]|uniref:Fatty acid hydroxylase domain-containing protein n=1 Tax=Aspergillus wentii DTO 134E9 TaxID=1073089 RepID=A0A1L9RIJ6_ASPWE|nr:uncharacterized protein ASPWEDRAFT_171584 [Aspergillus wentii DTO 134E9]KAI9932289.1 hypothetical protein MW887_009801 [Aspergillus wentii]OJJ34749.1 hypothetical protein ASPWEDRAFT_171584 [Aspergillus wentii DTO 134E9]